MVKCTSSFIFFFKTLSFFLKRDPLGQKGRLIFFVQKEAGVSNSSKRRQARGVSRFRRRQDRGVSTKRRQARGVSTKRGVKRVHGQRQRESPLTGLQGLSKGFGKGRRQRTILSCAPSYALIGRPREKRLSQGEERLS